MVPKKSIFERMGLIEHSQKEQELGFDMEATESVDMESIPDLENVPDLTGLGSHSTGDFQLKTPVEEEVKTQLTLETKSSDYSNKESEPTVKVEDIPQNISDKLDLIIGAYEKNKLLTIDEIYRNAHLESEVKKTIFMADVYLKAIPENLPIDIKRETVLNIMNVSNISLDDLLNDAYRRIDSLNTVLEETVSTTQDVFNRNDATIRELEKRIEDLREINKNRKKFQEDQNTMIEYEIQKIINLVEFVKPKK
ncbi:MAG: hypothetical protein LCH34_05115 [Firmicutes bacterium]|nr:hypothetical protein [Bacillota bacterium]